ncbi:recombinase family protein [Eubacteriaceae bacterium ES2]|nr:recombinase family protein [Eubacteriaceae bacterium ES2]
MTKKKVKVYIYTRVSTTMQVDGFSLNAQKERIRKYADAFNYEIAGEYEDAGKSGKYIDGRPEFKKMLEDINSNKDGVSYVLVFKLSRFGRNAADILNSLQLMQDNGVDLISVEDGIDSSKDAGKLVITILSAVAEIERENILVQTMEGRKQKAREGKWNGGFAPYGYKLINGKLEIEKDEAKAIRLIFDKYVNTDMGANGIAKYLQQQGIGKIARQNGKCPYFSAGLITQILDNVVYNGKITYGRRKNEKVKGQQGKTQLVKQDNYILSDGIHEAIIDEDTWEKAQEKRKAQTKRYEHVNKSKEERIHLLSGLLKCPHCGAGMYGNKSIKRKNGKHYKDYFYYGCKHRTLLNGHTCTYNKQLNEDKLDNAVAEVISNLVSSPKFANMIQKKINIKTDTIEVEKEISNFQKQMGKYIGTKRSLENQIDSLDVDDRHYDRKLSDFQDRLEKMYDNIDDIEQRLKECKERKKAIEAEKLTADNVYKTLIYFDKLYAVMDAADKRSLLSALVKEINIYEAAKPNGQWLKSMIFKLPIIEDNMEISLDNDEHVETVILMTRCGKNDK